MIGKTTEEILKEHDTECNTLYKNFNKTVDIIGAYHDIVGGEIHPVKMVVDISGICWWDGEMWNKDISLDFTGGSRIAETDKIYAWADVFIPLDDSACIHLYD